MHKEKKAFRISKLWHWVYGNLSARNRKSFHCSKAQHWSLESQDLGTPNFGQLKKKTLSTPNFGTNIWSVKSFLFSTLQNLVVNLGRLRAKHSSCSKLQHKSLEHQECFVLGPPKFMTKLWTAKNKKLSMLKNSTMSLGGSREFFSYHSKLRHQSLEHWKL